MALENKIIPIRMLIMPTTYFLALLFLSIIISFTFPIYTFVYPPFNYIGALIVLIGIIINIWASALFSKSKTSLHPHHLPIYFEKNGPYKMSRHPMYTGLLIMLLGADIVLGNVSTLISPVIFVILMETIFIPIEEKNMELVFKEEYPDYKKKVRRWI